MVHVELFNHYSVLIESIYSFLVFISCLFIYLGTKKLYSLTSHKGIRYFRDTFLFFGIAFFSRFLLHLVVFSRLGRVLFYPYTSIIFEILFAIIVYSSIMAFIYVILSMLWKKIEKTSFNNTFIFHGLAILIAIFSIIEPVPLLFFFFQAILFVLLVIVGYIQYKKTKNKVAFSELYLIYIMIFFSWIVINLIQFVTYIMPLIGLVFYVLFIILFVIILLKVLKKIRSS